MCIRDSILDDRRIRLALSVLGAIVAWMVVTIIVQPGTTNTIYNVPVDYTLSLIHIFSGGIFISPGVPFSVASSTPPVIISLTRSTFCPLAFLS